MKQEFCIFEKRGKYHIDIKVKFPFTKAEFKEMEYGIVNLEDDWDLEKKIEKFIKDLWGEA